MKQYLVIKTKCISDSFPRGGSAQQSQGWAVAWQVVRLGSDLNMARS